MQGKYPEKQSQKMEGFLQKSFNKMNEKTQKPVFWLVILIFFMMGLTGYWIGSTMVVQSVGFDSNFELLQQDSKTNTYLLLEVDDLSVEKPQLISIWFVHLRNNPKPSLGFTPVISSDQSENDDIKLLKNNPLDANNLPARELLKTLSRKGFSTTNYIIIDQISSAVFINWFSGKELTDPILVSNHSMAQYGQVLRGLCSTLSSPVERGITEFPWSKIVPGHFITSINFIKVIENLAFLNSPQPPKCEMVPLP